MGSTGYYTTGKDPPPTGWTDDGEQYTKTVRTKDSTPDGFTDNGTEWVRTTDKVEQVVPAEGLEMAGDRNQRSPAISLACNRAVFAIVVPRCRSVEARLNAVA